MNRPIAAYLYAVLGVGGVAWLTSALLPVLGQTSSALLFLLPVLFASARGGLGPGLLAALAGATAYNYYLLPPQYTFRIHGSENIVSVAVLVAVALVTSRLATLLKAREAEALARASASEETAALSAELGKDEAGDGLERGITWLEQRYGSVRLFADDDLPEGDAAFSSLDLSALGWALHNGDVTGHGTQVMPAADWTFLPLTPHNHGNGSVAAVARPATGETRGEDELLHLQQLVFLIGQAWNRVALARERRERGRLEESDRLRRALLASIAHDLRTPLTVIVGRLEALAGSGPEAEEALVAARRLDRMMDDLIGAARLESGTLGPRLESLDVIDVIDAACAALSLPDGIRLERSVIADLPFVKGDPVLLHHVMLNLLDNAARHARSRILVEAGTADGQMILSVSDDGPGIPEGEREKIFDRFARLEGSDRHSGSGLGLAIVKGFAEAMGMAVAVSKGPLGGACFHLSMSCTSGERT